MKQFLGFILFIVVTSFLFVGCTSNSTDTSNHPLKGTYKADITGMTPPYLPGYKANTFGSTWENDNSTQLRKPGPDLEIRMTFDSSKSDSWTWGSLYYEDNLFKYGPVSYSVVNPGVLVGQLKLIYGPGPTYKEQVLTYPFWHYINSDSVNDSFDIRIGNNLVKFHK